MARYVKGQSGNPSGMQKGTKQKHTVLKKAIKQVVMERPDLPEDVKNSILDKAIELAQMGDKIALPIFMERLLPPKPKEKMINIKLPNGTPAERAECIIQAVAKGKMSPTAGEKMMGLVKTKVDIKKMDDFEVRLAVLEQQQKS